MWPSGRLIRTELPVEIQGDIEGQSFVTRFGGMGKVELTPTKADYSANISNLKTGEKRTDYTSKG
jgi:hypothetical protein